MRLALISVLGLVAAACGDDSVTIGSNQANFCDQIAEVACHNLYQCCTESEIESRLGVTDPRTELQCRDDYTRRCERGAADVRDSIKAGRATFDAKKLDACLQAILAPADTCSMIEATSAMIPWTDPCSALNAPWIGTVAVGGACVFQIDCAGAPDTFCGPDLKCKMKPTAGFPCSGSSPCASAYYCDTTGTCAPKLANGAKCLVNQQQCDKDLFCDTKGTIDPADDVCAPKGAGGASCVQTNSSAANSACLSNQCIPGTCSGSFGVTCYSSATCGGRCSITGTSCTQTYPDCNSGGGTCTGDGRFCTNDTTCSTAGQGTCLFTKICQPSECVGDVVCSSTVVTADYCTAVGATPNP